MQTLVRRMAKSGLIAGATLAVAGFAVSYLFRIGLNSQGIETTDDNGAIVAGLMLGAVGFCFAVVLELLSSGWRAVFGKTPANPPTESAT